jgi:hypothetical protein
VAGVALPNGWVLDAGDEVVIPDTEWTLVEDTPDLLDQLLDLGTTTDLPPSPPSWRDIQRQVGGGTSGSVDDVAAALGAHIADTTDVHGISDTADLETQAGAASKVSSHNADTTGVHGIADTADLATKAYVDAAVSSGSGSPEHYQHVQSAPASQWTVVHNLGRYPSLVLRLTSNPGEPVYTDVDYVDSNTALVTWPSPETGWADAS